LREGLGVASVVPMAEDGQGALIGVPLATLFEVGRTSAYGRWMRLAPLGAGV